VGTGAEERKGFMNRRTFLALFSAALAQPKALLLPAETAEHLNGSGRSPDYTILSGGRGGEKTYGVFLWWVLCEYKDAYGTYPAEHSADMAMCRVLAAKAYDNHQFNQALLRTPLWPTP